MKNPDDLLRKLNEQQRQAVAYLRGVTQITAGAGTGKTTTIAHKIAFGIASGVYNPSKILAMSYTARSAGELRDRLNALGVRGVSVRTLHSAALAQLQYFWPIHTRAKLPSLEPSKVKLLTLVSKPLGFTLDDRQIRELASEIEWRKYRLISLDRYREIDNRPLVSGLTREQQQSLIERYEGYKAENSIIDWEDVLLLNLGLLKSEPAALSHVHSQFRHFFVDEFQDISPLQWQMLTTWMGKAVDLTVVGDPLQAIFGFAGADVRIMRQLESEFATMSQLELVANYRSAMEVLIAAKQLLPDSKLESGLPKTKQRGGSASLHKFASPESEASWIAAEITRALADGKAPGEIAVLVRLTHLLQPIRQRLQVAGVTTLTRGAPFFADPSVARVVSLVRALQVSPADEPLFAQLQKILVQVGWRQQVAKPASEEWLRLNWFMERLESLGENASIEEFVADLEDLQRAQYEPDLGLVTLSTIHAAKGLEWNVVFVAQLSDGVLPYYRAINDPDRLDEERRLLYVAMTRAGRKLALTYSIQDEHGRRLQPSRFLEGTQLTEIQ